MDQTSEIVTTAFLQIGLVMARGALAWIGDVYINQPWVVIAVAAGYVATRVSRDRRWRLI